MPGGLQCRRCAVGELGGSGVLFHRDAGKIGHLLAQPGETIEQVVLRVGRPHQRHGAHCRRARRFRYRLTSRRTTDHGNRRIRSRDTRSPRDLWECRAWRARHARHAWHAWPAHRGEPSSGAPWSRAQGDFRTIHLEDARIAPGALFPAVMRVPGTNPSSIRRRASSAGKSIPRGCGIAFSQVQQARNAALP